MPSFDPSQPYNDLPSLPPTAELETKAILKQCVAARTALVELQIAGRMIPDQSVLINAIPLLEAKASSEIENIVTSHDALFREASLAGSESDPATKEAVRYRRALYQGFESLKERPIVTRTAVEICQTIKGIALDIRTTPGTTLKNSRTGKVVYTPPVGPEALRVMLSNWERFINEPTDLDPVVQMAVQHYQFEAIHPFVDGNGRTGRILNILVLVQARLLDMPTLYLSRHILRTRDEYYRALLAVTTDQKWEDWVLYMLGAVTETARWTSAKLHAIKALMEETSQQIRLQAPRIYSQDLVSLIFSQPYCRIANVVERGIAKRQTAAEYLRTLADLGVLNEVKLGRDKLFNNWSYSDMLSDVDDPQPGPRQ